MTHATFAPTHTQLLLVVVPVGPPPPPLAFTTHCSALAKPASKVSRVRQQFRPQRTGNQWQCDTATTATTMATATTTTSPTTVGSNNVIAQSSHTSGERAHVHTCAGASLVRALCVLFGVDVCVCVRRCVCVCVCVFVTGLFANSGILWNIICVYYVQCLIFHEEDRKHI